MTRASKYGIDAAGLIGAAADVGTTFKDLAMMHERQIARSMDAIRAHENAKAETKAAPPGTALFYTDAEASALKCFHHESDLADVLKAIMLLRFHDAAREWFK